MADLVHKFHDTEEVLIQGFTLMVAQAGRDGGARTIGAPNSRGLLGNSVVHPADAADIPRQAHRRAAPISKAATETGDIVTAHDALKLVGRLKPFALQHKDGLAATCWRSSPRWRFASI